MKHKNNFSNTFSAVTSIIIDYLIMRLSPGIYLSQSYIKEN